MAKSFDDSDRNVDKAPSKLPEQRSKATGGGASPLDPMGSSIPGWSAPCPQTPGDSANPRSDFTKLGESTNGDKKSPGLPGR